jgi:flagellar basal-body rod modification protein FlgD
MSTTAVGSTTSSGSAAGTVAAATNTAQDLSDRFMKLLVAQMQNQDPLNPMDNAQVTSQMAQINTVSGINGVNSSITQLLAQIQQLETMQAAQLTGRTVLAPGSGLGLETAATGTAGGSAATAAAGTLNGAYELAGAVDNVAIEVRDSRGVLVRTIAQAPTNDGGLQRFAWDGRTDGGDAAAAGSYTFSVKATAGGAAVAATTYSARRVEGVTQANGTLSLVLAGGTSVAYGDIKQFL